MSSRVQLIAVISAWFLVTSTVPAQEFLGKRLETWRDELGSKDATTRRSAAYALGKMGRDAERALPKLIDLLKDESDAGVKAQGATSVGEIALALGTSSSFHWRTAGPELMRLLTDSDPMVRRGAAYALGAFGGEAFPARDALRRALRDSHAIVRQNAAWALGRLGAEAGENAIETLCSILTDDNPLVRRDAVQAIGNIGLPKAKSAVNPLIALVQKEANRFGRDEVVLKTALEKLVNLVGPENKNLAVTLFPLLDNADPEVRRLSAFVLANIDLDSARPALSVLQKALSDPDPLTQELAAGALARIFEAAHLKQSPNFQLQRDFKMSDLFPDIDSTVAALRAALAPDRSVKVRINAAVALGHIGPEGKSAVDQLRLALKKETPIHSATPLGFAEEQKARRSLRLAAAETLALFSYDANAAALPDVLEVLANKNDDIDIRQRCVWSFFEAQAPNVLEHFKADRVLTDTLSETNRDSAIVRFEAARVLALAYREKAPDKVVDVLLYMLTNDDLQIFQGTGAEVKNVGSNENRGGKSNVATKQSGDGRFMAAEALGLLGEKGRQQRVLDALQKASNDKDARLSEEAKKALTRIGN